MTAGSPLAPAAPPFAPPADRRSALDPAHVGDIEGALATLPAFDTGPRRTSRRRLVTMLAVLGPGVVVMVASNDAGSFSVFAEAGQNHGLTLLWVLLILGPALYVTQEMVARLGAVTGAGHARLTLERFGRLWCGFSLVDLLALNLLVIVTEFIGVALALGYFGIGRAISVPVAAVALVAVSSGGSFRRWERAMWVMVAGDLLLVPLVLVLHHSGATPALLGSAHAAGATGGMVLLLVALIGATIAPWQLFFQQSTVVDKRITPRWLGYERADTAIGAVLFVLGAGAVLILSAWALGASPLHGHFDNVGTVLAGVSRHLGAGAGAVFAIALLNASLLGAAAVSLSGAYAISEVRGVKHSLHRRFFDARGFHGSVAAIVVVGAGIVLIPGLRLGPVTTLVQALTGVLLPPTLIIVLILCNDEQLLGPQRNGPRLNLIAAGVIALIVGLSTLLTLRTTFPDLRLGAASAITVAIVLAAGVPVAWSCRGGLFHRAAATSSGEPLTPWQRRTWSAPALELVPAMPRTRPRTLALAVARGYVLVMLVLLVIKLAGVPFG